MSFAQSLYALILPANAPADDRFDWSSDELTVQVIRNDDDVDFYVLTDQEQQLREALGFDAKTLSEQDHANLGMLYMGRRYGRAHLRLRRPMLLVQLLDLGVR